MILTLDCECGKSYLKDIDGYSDETGAYLKKCKGCKKELRNQDKNILIKKRNEILKINCTSCDDFVCRKGQTNRKHLHCRYWEQDIRNALLKKTRREKPRCWRRTK